VASLQLSRAKDSDKSDMFKFGREQNPIKPRILTKNVAAHMKSEILDEESADNERGLVFVQSLSILREPFRIKSPAAAAILEAVRIPIFEVLAG
jgi:hypothetical protein